MDIFDLPFLPGPRPPRGGGDPRDELVGGAVAVGLPLIYLCVLIPTDLTKQPDLAVLWLPVGLGLVGAAICLLTRISLGRAIVAVLSCMWWSLVAALTMVVVDILVFPF
ncbi:MAG TPA: hypothetical protein VF712_18900 [Thermoleophilaceae bacterium]